jgi:hypothetical protein
MKHKRKLRKFSRTFLIPAIGEQRKESRNAYTNNRENRQNGRRRKGPVHRSGSGGGLGH